MNLPSLKNINQSKEELLHAIQKAIYQRDAAELLRLSFICNDIYGMRINEDGSLTPINQRGIKH